ncbi:kinase-like domain-containing protein [Rhizophagus irregularis DAOM 181602=DAOM 197198]|nr:kinase-like domain-containing protein [Rhizophagus irregularis DAOM 181602=DAOM 197198]
MEEFILNDDVLEQIKDFDYKNLTEEQKCKQPRASDRWCQCKFQQNFKNWTSGNHEVDKFIQKVQLKAKDYHDVLEWIEYDRFENVEHLAKGGFGTIYKAIWKDGRIDKWDFENNKLIRSKYWFREYEKFPVVLKCLHNSQDITSDFLREIETHNMISHSIFITQCFGITKDPESRNFIIVMAYVINGLIHRDFHCGNILKEDNYALITDLGLCRPANVKPSQNECKELYGVLPYVAPEVLRGKEFTQESDIYGFGIIAYEVCTGLPPYHDIAHDKFLTISICQGLRPKSNYKIPQLILNIIKQCWDADPLKRPKAIELYNLFNNLWNESCDNESEFKKQIEEADKINEKLISSSLSYTGPTLSYTTNPQAIYTSRLLDFKNLPEPKNDIDNKDE